MAMLQYGWHNILREFSSFIRKLTWQGDNDKGQLKPTVAVKNKEQSTRRCFVPELTTE